MKLTITITTDQLDHITAEQAAELKHQLNSIIERFEDPTFFHKTQERVNGDGVTLKGCTVYPMQNITVYNIVEAGEWGIDPYDSDNDYDWKVWGLHLKSHYHQVFPKI